MEKLNGRGRSEQNYLFGRYTKKKFEEIIKL
jgi:hypothetical protein